MKLAKKSPAMRKSPEHGVNKRTDSRAKMGHAEPSLSPRAELDFERQQRIAERASKPSTSKVNAAALSALSSKRKGLPMSDAVREVHATEMAGLVAPDLDEAIDAVANTPKVAHINGGVLLTDDLFEAMCVAIGKGAHPHQLCERPGMPRRETFFERCQRDSLSAKRYSKALEMRGERFADQIVEIADEAMYAETPEQAAAYRLRVETRKWLAARLLPKKYGERVTLEGNADNPLVTQLVLGGDALAKRIRGGGAKD